MARRSRRTFGGLPRRTAFVADFNARDVSFACIFRRETFQSETGPKMRAQEPIAFNLRCSSDGFRFGDLAVRP